MLKKSLLLMLLMTLLVPWAANAQATLPIGDGTSYSTSGSSAGQGSGSPMGNTYYYNSAAQFIYTASELGGAKTINSLAFYHNAKSFSANLKIYLTHTTSATVDVNSPATDGTLVYDGASITIGGSSAGWQTFDFDNNFEYNGTDNLLVVVCRTVYNSGYNSSQGWQYTATTGNQFMVRSSDTGTYGDITNTSNAYTAFANRPNVLIGYVVTTPYVSLDPANATIVIGHTQDLTASYVNVTGTPTITYSSSNPKIASVSGSGTSATVTGNSVGTATITATMTYNATEYTATCAVTVEEPSYCKPSFSNTSDYIKSFTTTGGEQNINNTNTGQGTGGYSNFYDTHFVSAEPETEIGFSVVRGYNDEYNYAIWVDWNKDYEFDNTTEKVAYTTSSTGDWTGTFTIPTTAAAGDYHMRVIQVYSSAATPCVSASYGEGEDYKLTVLAGNPYQKPTDLTVTDLGPFNATIGWTAPSTDVVNYQYQYMPEGGDWTSPKTTTELSAPLSGLTAETNYTFRVKAIYAGGESDFATKEFTTTVACETPTNLTATDITADGATLGWTSDADNFNIRYRTAAIEPITFFDDFESGISQWTTVANDYSGTGTNWRAFNVDNFDDPNLTNHSGSYVAMSRSYDGSDHSVDNWLITPQVTLDGTLKFWAINDDGGGYAEHYSIYVSTTGNDVADFTEIYVPDDCTAWTEFTVDLTSYNGVPGYIAIRHLDEAKDFLFIDDFGIYGTATPAGDWKYTTSNTNSRTIGGLNELTVYDFEVQAVCGGIYGESDWAAGTFETLPSCMPISDLDVAATTATTVTLVWTDNNGGSATYVVTDGDDPVTVTGLTATGCTVTGLIANTAYTFKVKADCGSGYSTAETINVRTDCNPITTIPYYESFEDDGYYCWSYDGFSKLSNSTYAHTGNISFFADGSVTTPQYLIFPEMGEDISGLMMNFWYYNYNDNNCGTLYVGYLTDDTDYSSFTSVESIDMSTGITSYKQTQYFAFNAAPAGSIMAFKYVGYGTQYSYIIIDDVTVDVLDSCMAPYDLEVDNTSITGHGATFSWTSNGSETEWHLYFSKENTAPADDINLKEVTVADSNPFTLTTGLDPETNYYVWVRASCGGTDGNSSWVGPETFTTEVACPAPTGLAASEITGHTAKLSWTGTNESYNVRYRTAASVDPVLTEDFENETHYNNNWTVVNLSTANTPGRNSNAGHNSSYGFRFSSYSSASTYEEHLINTNELTGLTNGVIEFYYKKTNSSTETFAVGYSSTDKETTSFSFGANVTATTSWQLFHEEIPAGTKYVSIKYTTTGCYYYIYIDDIVIGNVIPAGTWQTVNPAPDSSPCTISDLSAETKYEAQVQGNCGGEGTSQWSNIFSFTTDIACYPATGLAYDNLKSNRVDLTWTSEADAWVLAYKLASDDDFTEIDLTSSDVTVEGTTVTYQLTGLTAEKEYAVKVRNNCGGGDLSAWTNVITFETLAACAQPTGVTVDNIGHHTADVAWTGDSDSFTVKYRTAAGIIPIFSEDFNNGIGNWTMVNCHSSTGISNNVFRFHWSSNPPQYLISPEITGITDNAVLQFVYYNNSTTYEETFKVGLSSTDNDTESFTWSETVAVQDKNQHIYEATVPAGTKYMAIQLLSDDMYYLYVDNIVIGTLSDAGDWQTVISYTTEASLEGLTPGTKYELAVVPSCDSSMESDMVDFTTVSGDYKYFLTEGNWNVDTNWEPVGVPTSTQDVELFANVTIPSGCVAEAQNVYGYSTYTLTIEDGGQLKHNNSSVRATVKKNITGYGEGNANWYLISNPLYQTIYEHTSSYTPNISSTGIIDGDYDLYNWDNTEDYEWRNYKANEFANAFDLDYGLYGYLYANKADGELSITGTVRSSNSYVYRYLTDYSSSYELGGWYLLGNPYVCDAYLVDASTNGQALPYYKMNAEGTEVEAVSNGAPIAPMTGIFYETATSGSVYMVRTAPTPSTSNGNGNLNIALAQNVNSRDAVAATDKAIVRFDGGQQLGKFSFRENSTKMYIPQDSKKYAVVSAEASGTLPLNLKVEKTGSYTISFSNEDVEFTYLHLIDGITGEDIDLLVEGSYTFNASVRDRENRFTLVFNSIDSNIDATSDIFVYQNDDQIVVSGEGELQVYDVMGRYVGSYDVNGTETLNASQFANNVYIFRLVGETVKTQKIVVR